MSYSPLPTINPTELVGSAYLNQIRDNFAHLGGLQANGVPLQDLAAGAELRAPDYDSGWFSVTYNSSYAKAHGLPSIPRDWAVYWANSASPSTWERVFTVRGSSDAALQSTADASNITVFTGSDSARGVLLRASGSGVGSGYYRIVAWV